MKKLRLAVFFCAASLPALCQIDNDQEKRSRIIALENAWDQAEGRQDLRTLDTIFDNSLVYVDYDGRLMTKAEFLVSVKEEAAHVPQIVTESISVTVFDKIAVSSGIYRERGVDAGKPYVRRGRFIDTWVYKNFRWVCIATQSTPLLH
jgi:hypothetical protein